MRLAASLIAVLLALTCGGNPAIAHGKETADPLGSARWKDMERDFLSDGPVQFDERVKVISSGLAENPLQVPITVDATALTGVKEVLVFADFNPILEILRFYPESTSAYLGFRAKLQQSSPVRAAAKTADGVWHVGGVWVNTTGGGCTAPSAASTSSEWQKRLNEVTARTWSEGPMSGRVRLRIIHPMDTGLMAGVPAFHLEEVVLKDAAGKRLMRLEISQPVSENPVFTLNRGAVQGSLMVSGRDNNGNMFDVRVAP
ncbi:MAG: quinoprotein dehydrogenase-associated SoxYZ-like carrier [Zoogloea sp.]|nr:quinoprotein dehydrogenase-associated SoxYZ-like carrier [Zoogloea sp.]